MKKTDGWRAWFLLVIGILVTLVATIYIKSETDKKDEAEFKFKSKEIGRKINVRLQSHAQLLRSGVALFEASDTVTRQNWKDFIKQSKVDLNLPGIQGIGFSLIIPKKELHSHIQKVRKEGFSNYKVWPEKDREVYTSIIYLEPFEGSNLRAFGYDLMTEPTRRDALERARDRDAAALTSKLFLVQEGKTNVQPGTIMYVPVYRKGAQTKTIEQRRNAIIGWVSSPYRMNDLISGILSNWESEDNLNEYSLTIYDGFNHSSEALLFESYKLPNQKIRKKTRFLFNFPIDFNGHHWTLIFTQRQGNIFSDYMSVWIVFLGGSIISILLFFLTKSLIGTKYKAQIIAETLTEELKESERLLKESQKIASIGSYSLNVETGIWNSSEILDLMFGIDKNYNRTVEGWRILVHADYREELAGYLTEVIQEKKFFDKEYKIVRNSDKQERWVHGRGKLEFDDQNNPVRLIGTIRDITQQKHTEERLHMSREQYRSLFQNSPLGIYQSTPGGRVINANPSLLKMLEFESLEELQKRNLQEEGYSVYSSVTRAQFLELMNKDGCVKGLEEDWTTATGKIIPVRENAIVVKGKDGNVLYYEGTVEDITERKKAETEIRSITNRLQLATRTANIGIWDFDVINNRLIWDDVMYNLYGIAPQDFSGAYEAWEAGLHPDDLQRGREELQAALRGEKKFDTEFRVVWPDKSVHYLKATGFVDFNASGDPMRMLGTNMDITERKTAEVLLKESEKRFRTIIEASPVPLVITKVKDGEVVMANNSLGELFNIPVSEAIGKKSPDFYHRMEDRNMLLKAVTKDGHVDNFEIVLKKLDGELFWSSVSLKLMTLDNEKMLIVGFHDITDRKKAEEELKKHREHLEEMVSERTKELIISEQKLKRSIKDITDYKLALDESSIVTITDCEGVISYVNKNFCKISKYNQDEISGKTHRIVNSNYHSKEFFDDLWRTISRGKTWRGEIKNKAKDGKFYWVDSTIVPFINEKGTPYQYISIRFDISAKKLVEEDLIKAKEAADSANRAKSEFLANMSHEIRTPMNAVIGFSELLAKSVREEKQRSQVESIRSSGKNLLKIINDILDLSKIEANKIKIEAVPGSLTDLLNEVENIFTLRVVEKGIHFKVKYESRIPKILVFDEVRLRQILFNLIGNALKFTDKGHVIVNVETRKNRTVKETYDLTLRVEDTGIGIRSDQQEIIFEPFSQQAGQSLKYGGTGLGLPITKKLVEKMGGTISLESEENKGSNFTIYIPEIPVSDVEIELVENEFDPSAIKFESAKILLVDDNEDNRKLIIDLVEHSKLTVFEASNGEEAVQMALKHLPDLLLMDLRMPVMDGYEATKILKENKLTAKIPIIAISASTRKIMYGDLSKKIFDEYIMKPLNPPELFEKMKKYLTYKVVENISNTIPETETLTLTDEQLKRLPNLIEVLENKFVPVYDTIVKSQMIDEIEMFAKDLKSLARENEIQFLINYADKLCRLADNFEIDDLLKTLHSFLDIMKQLTSAIENE